jgi:hypothetical protein
MTEEQIKYMVNRFLGWKLPSDFNPDGGITFNPEYNVEYNAKRGLPPARHEPTGTNVFDYNQAMSMVRYMIEGMSDSIKKDKREKIFIDLYADGKCYHQDNTHPIKRTVKIEESTGKRYVIWDSSKRYITSNNRFNFHVDDLNKLDPL